MKTTMIVLGLVFLVILGLYYYAEATRDVIDTDWTDSTIIIQGEEWVITDGTHFDGWTMLCIKRKEDR